MPIKLTITDDHPLVVSGLHSLLLAAPQIEVVSTYTSGEELLEGLKKIKPDVLLLDLQMPGLSGANLIDIIKLNYPEVRIIMLTGEEAAIHAQEMMRHGCMGFLLKSTTEQTILVTAIEEVYKGNIFLEPSIKEDLLYNMLKIKKQEEDIVPVITSREKEVLKLIVAGLKSQEIADKLFVSIRTIHSHRHSLLQKLNVNNTAGLIKMATDLKLIN